jgi:hypothetical protein
MARDGNHNDAYLRFLYETAARQTLEEKGLGDWLQSKITRGAKRVANAAVGTVGGQWSSAGNKAHGRMEVMDLAGKLRQMWFQHVGRLTGTSEAEPTRENIINWVNKTFDINLPVDPSDSVSDEEVSDDENDAVSDDESDQDTSGDPDGDQPATPQPQPQPQPQPASDEQPPQPASDEQEQRPAAKPFSIAAVHADALAKKMVDSRVKKEVVAAAGRTPEQHLIHLRRMLQYLAPKGIVDPITRKKPEPHTSELGKQMMALTHALINSDETDVSARMSEMQSNIAASRDQNIRKTGEEYIEGVLNDPIVQKKFPRLKQTISNAQQPQPQIAPGTHANAPFKKLYLKVAGELARYKDEKNKQKPTPQQSKDFIDALSALVEKGAAATPAERQKVEEIMEPIESDSVLMNKFPEIQKVVARFKSLNMAEGFESDSYLAHLFETAGALGILAEHGISPNAKLSRVQLDKFFEFIAQTLFRKELVTYSDNDGEGGSSSGSRDGLSGGDNKRRSAAGMGGFRFNPDQFRREAENARLRSTDINDLSDAIRNDDDESIEAILKKLDPEERLAVSLALTRALT